MTAKQQIHSCSVCGQIVTVVHHGGGKLVCCGRPMMLSGDELAGAAAGAKKLRTEPVAKAALAPDAPFWRCSSCNYVLQASQPPEVCPSCQKNCQFVDVTCYIPECGFSGVDARLITGR
jgi:desulfoferrodoxin-like iron-binding protein